MSGPLEGRVALVAGATRGAGRGSAVALGEAGATVYCTGRSTRERRSEGDRPETIEETAELVSAAGGVAIAVAVDHLEAAEVEALVQRTDAEHGRLDVLVKRHLGIGASLRMGHGSRCALTSRSGGRPSGGSPVDRFRSRRAREHASNATGSACV